MFLLKIHLCSIAPHKKFKKKKKKKKKKKRFTGGQTLGSVDQEIFLKIFFPSGGENYSPKKTLKSPQNLTFFGENFWKNIFSY